MHSLLLGPRSWAPVAAELPAAIVLSLASVTATDDPPFWPRVAAVVHDLPPGGPIVIVAHSNAGLMVPAIVAAARRPVAGCLFVDARVPARTGSSPAASPERLATLRAMAAADGRLPPWTTWWPDDEVDRLFPDERTRVAVTAEQPRVPLSYYQEQVPAPAGWDDRPCGYVLFSPAYEEQAGRARERGWPVTHLPGGHLHQLVDPAAVAARLMDQSWWGGR